MIHFRVHEQGKVVRTFCNKVVLRNKTKPYRKAQMYLSFPVENTISCPACWTIGKAYHQHAQKTPATVRRMRQFILDRFGGVYPTNPTKSAHEESLELLAQAELEASLMADKINAKHRDAERVVKAAFAAVKRLERREKATATFLKKAKKRLAASIKKLEKTPTYTPPPKEDDQNEPTGF